MADARGRAIDHRTTGRFVLWITVHVAKNLCAGVVSPVPRSPPQPLRSTQTQNSCVIGSARSGRGGPSLSTVGRRASRPSLSLSARRPSAPIRRSQCSCSEGERLRRPSLVVELSELQPRARACQGRKRPGRTADVERDSGCQPEEPRRRAKGPRPDSVALVVPRRGEDRGRPDPRRRDSTDEVFRGDPCQREEWTREDPLRPRI